ncbi:type II toxin-antitoxin system Phd/YefM family antitoxin [Actinorugispora endophytica]|uniref:type II toxin-antitoxin system Phd/YefM family antitoxin n=1 Tax=Actinorugispora endophytica TaxID=1605990 RepID=UPI00105DDADB|nr:type II toxin-antitoxin system prevent-host-death family antitoxin [Actinorugispora endophytica]
MSEEINQRELRNESGRVLQAAERGESFVITRNGAPVAKPVPLENKRSSCPEAN